MGVGLSVVYKPRHLPKVCNPWTAYSAYSGYGYGLPAAWGRYGTSLPYSGYAGYY